MLEREMEDLIAAYPDQFFPRHDFVLKGRQKSFAGVGRFDLMFVDRHGMNILIELKATPAKYDVIDQVARYRDALFAQGTANVLMWIVAPRIPPGLREFLTHLGIEYAEITSSEFRRIGESVGYKFADAAGLEPTQTAVSASPPTHAPTLERQAHHPSSSARSSEIGFDSWGFGCGTQPSFLIKMLEQGDKTKEQIRSSFISRFYPGLSFAEAKSKSGFGVFFSDSKRPIGTYHASRSLVILKDTDGRLSLEPERAELAKKAISAGILSKLRGLHFQRDRREFNAVVESFGLPVE